MQHFLNVDYYTDYRSRFSWARRGHDISRAYREMGTKGREQEPALFLISDLFANYQQYGILGNAGTGFEINGLNRS